MRVLVTGIAGFLGSHVAEALLEDKHDVTGVDDLSTGSESWIPMGVRYFKAPVLTHVEWYDGPPFDVVVHCAARADIRRNHEAKERALIWHSNVESTHRLVEATSSEAHFIFVSTGAVYGDRREGEWRRHDPARPGSLYAASKVAGEALVAARGFAAWHVLRVCSMLGPRYHHGHVADFVEKRRLHRKPIEALDSGEQRKDYRDVRDVASIIAELAREPRASGVYNVGGQPWSVRDTVRVMGAEASWGTSSRGWAGDPLNVRLADDFGSRFSRPVEESVRDTLTSLGWGEP